MASLETLHSRQAKVEAPQKCQLTTAEGGQGSSPAVGTPFSAGRQVRSQQTAVVSVAGMQTGPQNSAAQAAWTTQQ